MSSGQPFMRDEMIDADEPPFFLRRRALCSPPYPRVFASPVSAPGGSDRSCSTTEPQDGRDTTRRPSRSGRQDFKVAGNLEIRPLAGRTPQLIDLKGKTVTPGLTIRTIT
jgi:hypothetical protein